MVASQSLNPESRKRGGGKNARGEGEHQPTPSTNQPGGTQKFSGPDALVVVVVVVVLVVVVVVVAVVVVAAVAVAAAAAAGVVWE